MDEFERLPMWAGVSTKILLTIDGGLVVDKKNLDKYEYGEDILHLLSYFVILMPMSSKYVAEIIVMHLFLTNCFTF